MEINSRILKRETGERERERSFLCVEFSANSNFTFCLLLLLLATVKISFQGCRHSSVDSSVPTMPPPRVWVPSTPSMFFSFIVFVLYLSCEKNENNGFGPFFKNEFSKDSINVGEFSLRLIDLILSNMVHQWTSTSFSLPLEGTAWKENKLDCFNTQINFVIYKCNACALFTFYAVHSR